jgi:hypothetical protein
LEKGMFFDFPDFIGDRRIKASKKNHHHYTDNKTTCYFYKCQQHVDRS